MQNALNPANIYSILYHEFISSLPINHPTICFYRHNVNVINKTDLDRAVKNLQQESLPNVVVLFGLPSDQIHFVNFANWGFHTKHVWVVLDVDLRRALSTAVKKKIISLKNRFRQEMSYIQQVVGHKIEVNDALTKSEFLKVALKRLTSSKKSELKRIINNVNTVNMQGVIQKGFVNLFFTITSISIFTDAFYVDYEDVIHHLEAGSCKKLICTPGWYQTTGRLLQQQTKWTAEYGWTCRKCLGNHIKPHHGNSSCTRCPPHTLSNVLNTRCYDPYKPIFLKKNLTYVFSITLSIASMVLTIVLIIVFLTYRKTPIGKSSNLAMTMLHLIVNSLSHGILFYIQHIKPSFIYCIANIICSGVMYNLFVSVAFIKSHKLFKAFSSKRKATERDKKVTSMQQLFTIAILVAGSVVLLIVGFAQDLPSVVVRRDVADYLIYYSCSNLHHTFVQMGYGMSLQIACLVTAYRGRNLPSVFNESMSMVYSSFITTITTGVMFVVQVFQKDPLVAPFVTWIVLSMNTSTYLLFLYANKAYIMLFQKKKNTVRYIQEKTFDAMRDSSKNI